MPNDAEFWGAEYDRIKDGAVIHVRSVIKSVEVARGMAEASLAAIDSHIAEFAGGPVTVGVDPYVNLRAGRDGYAGLVDDLIALRDRIRATSML